MPSIGKILVGAIGATAVLFEMSCVEAAGGDRHVRQHHGRRDANIGKTSFPDVCTSLHIPRLRCLLPLYQLRELPPLQLAQLVLGTRLEYQDEWWRSIIVKYYGTRNVGGLKGSWELLTGVKTITAD